MANHLSVVPPADQKVEGLPSEIYDLGRGPETTAERVKRLQKEARILATEEVEALERTMEACAAQARQIAEGGDAYTPGVRDLAGRISAEIEQRAHMLQALIEKTSGL